MLSFLSAQSFCPAWKVFEKEDFIWKIAFIILKFSFDCIIPKVSPVYVYGKCHKKFPLFNYSLSGSPCDNSHNYKNNNSNKNDNISWSRGVAWNRFEWQVLVTHKQQDRTGLDRSARFTLDFGANTVESGEIYLKQITLELYTLYSCLVWSGMVWSGLKVSSSQGLKVPMSRGVKVSRSQGLKVSRSQGLKVSRSQGLKVLRS